MATAATIVGPATVSSALLNLSPLLERTRGIPEVAIGLIDGPVAVTGVGNVRQIPGDIPPVCDDPGAAASAHGTALANLLVASTHADYPSLAPGCVLRVRPLFTATGPTASANPGELASAIHDCIDAEVSVVNLSLALSHPSLKPEAALRAALDRAMAHDVVTVAAAGNYGHVGGTAIVEHPWVIPVAACDLTGQPLSYSNFGASIGRRGFLAPGVAPGLTGTSAAAAYVTGIVALLRSLYPSAAASHIYQALATQSLRRRRIVPPILDAGRTGVHLEAILQRA